MAKAVTPKKVDNRARRHALNMKTTHELRQKLQDRADRSGRVLTHEVEQQLIRSFELEEQLALSEAIRAEMKGTNAAHEKMDALLWPTEADRVLGQMFANVIQLSEAAIGSSWREDQAVAHIASKVVLGLMERFSRTQARDLLVLLTRSRAIAEAASQITEMIAEKNVARMPSLPPLEPQQDLRQWSGMARAVVTFKNKATGRILEVVEGPVLPLAELRGGNVPGLVEATDRHRPNKDNIDVEMTVVHVLKDDASVWDMEASAAV